MRTQVMLDRAAGMPWLERDLANGQPPETTPLPSFPFTIGRSESADLTIDSTRVSREHAAILCEAGKYRIRDLGSTNGTFVNGERIEESPLQDGDIVVLADIEFSFFSGQKAPERMVTQVMGPRKTDTPKETPAEIVRHVRRLHEALTHRAVESLFSPIALMLDGQVFGYEALDEKPGRDAGPSEAEQLLYATESRVMARLRRLRRTVAAEEALRLPPDVSLFLKLDASEIGGEGLIESLGRLRSTLADGRGLVVEVPDRAVSDTPYYREFRDRLHAMQIRIAHDEFSAGHAQLLQQKNICPDYLKLARPLIRAINHNDDHQRQVESLVQAGAEIGCEIIAVGVRSEEEAQACRDLGCRLGQGEFFGSPQPATALARLVPV